jgi:hypothetical protein
VLTYVALSGRQPSAEQPKPEAMRAFVLVSKVLQMIANGLSFSDKTSEAYAPRSSSQIFTARGALHVLIRLSPFTGTCAT